MRKQVRKAIIDRSYRMTPGSTATPPLLQARTAGFLYLLIICFGLFSELYVRSSLIVDGNAAATAANILASPGLFRAGFAADAVMLLCDVAVAVLFYVLLRPVNKTLALTAAAFRLTQAAVLGFNLLNAYAPLLLLDGEIYGSALRTDQLNAVVMLFLELHSYGYDLGLLFFGISNLILGYLMIRSGYFPGILGAGLAAAGAVYLAGSFTRFLFPDFLAVLEPFYFIPLIAELSISLWLLVKGVKVHP
jgi:hypothetical protein